jgi:hypothetical protein
MFRRSSDGGPCWAAVGDDHAVSIGLISGEDQTADALKVTRAAATPVTVLPLTDSLGLKPNSDVMLGTIGAPGDIIDTLIVNIQDYTRCAVFLRDGNVPDPVTGTSGTAPSAGTNLALTAASAFTATANQYAGRVLSVTYTPTSGTSSTFKRLIVGHAAVAASVTLSSLTVDETIPAGATITQWAIEHASSVQIVGPSLSDRHPLIIPWGRSINGGFRLSVDAGVQVTALGKFT